MYLSIMPYLVGLPLDVHEGMRDGRPEAPLLFPLEDDPRHARLDLLHRRVLDRRVLELRVLEARPVDSKVKGQLKGLIWHKL